MFKSLYVGNLPFDVVEKEIRDMFATYGRVNSVKLIMDRETGKFRGYAFVEMEREDAFTALEELNGAEFGGRILRINEAHDNRSPQGNRRREW